MTTHSTSLVRLDTPDEFTLEQRVGADLVLLLPPRRGARREFRPNLVVTSVAADTSIEEACSVTIASDYALTGEATMMSCAEWPHQGQPGRRLIFSYRAPDGSTIVVAKWLWATGAHQVQLTASAAAQQYLVLDELFASIASTVRFREES